MGQVRRPRVRLRQPNSRGASGPRPTGNIDSCAGSLPDGADESLRSQARPGAASMGSPPCEDAAVERREARRLSVRDATRRKAWSGWMRFSALRPLRMLRGERKNDGAARAANNRAGGALAFPFVVPAKGGTHKHKRCDDGQTGVMDSRFRGNDKKGWSVGYTFLRHSGAPEGRARNP
jgi:hypothetical protein